ncbi:MAG: DUF4268 domain-containing protein [Bacteroidota bacterium]
MYSKQEASLIRKNFWTKFGQYMKPLPGADGEPVNWLNYKTGIKQVFFRMDADNKRAVIAVEIRRPDADIRKEYFQKLEELKPWFHQSMNEDWEWQLNTTDEDGKVLSRIGKTLNGVNIFNSDDWPAIISFFKPRIILLDEFWSVAKERFT